MVADARFEGASAQKYAVEFLPRGFEARDVRGGSAKALSSASGSGKAAAPLFRDGPGFRETGTELPGSSPASWLLDRSSSHSSMKSWSCFNSRSTSSFIPNHSNLHALGECVLATHCEIRRGVAPQSGRIWPQPKPCQFWQLPQGYVVLRIGTTTTTVHTSLQAPGLWLHPPSPLPGALICARTGSFPD